MITFKNIESVISFIDNATFEAVIRRNKVYNKRGELVAAVQKNLPKLWVLRWNICRK